MNNEKEMTQEEAEADFKNMMAGIFMKEVPGIHIDEESSVICIPIKHCKKSKREK